MQSYREHEERFIPESEIKEMLILHSEALENLKMLVSDPGEWRIKQTCDQLEKLAWLVSDPRSKNEFDLSRIILMILPKLTNWRNGKRSNLNKSIMNFIRIKTDIKRLNRKLTHSYDEPVKPEN